MYSVFAPSSHSQQHSHELPPLFGKPAAFPLMSNHNNSNKKYHHSYHYNATTNTIDNIMDFDLWSQFTRNAKRRRSTLLDDGVVDPDIAIHMSMPLITTTSTVFPGLSAAAARLLSGEESLQVPLQCLQKKSPELYSLLLHQQLRQSRMPSAYFTGQHRHSSATLSRDAIFSQQQPTRQWQDPSTVHHPPQTQRPSRDKSSNSGSSFHHRRPVVSPALTDRTSPMSTTTSSSFTSGDKIAPVDCQRQQRQPLQQQNPPSVAATPQQPQQPHARVPSSIVVEHQVEIMRQIEKKREKEQRDFEAIKSHPAMQRQLELFREFEDAKRQRQQQTQQKENKDSKEEDDPAAASSTSRQQRVAGKIAAETGDEESNHGLLLDPEGEQRIVVGRVHCMTATRDGVVKSNKNMKKVSCCACQKTLWWRCDNHDGGDDGDDAAVTPRKATIVVCPHCETLNPTSSTFFQFLVSL